MAFLAMINLPAMGQWNDPYALYIDQQVRKNPLREFLNKFSFSFTAGYGRTFYKHELPGYGIINKDDSLYNGLYLFSLADSLNSPFVGFQNWLNAPMADSVDRFENIDLNNQVLGDTARLGFRGNAPTIPLTLIVHYNFLERFRLGAGISFERHSLPTMNPFVGEEVLGQYRPNVEKSTFIRYFGVFGGKVYQRMDWSYFVDIQIGKVKMGKAFEKESINQGIFFNIGVPIEYEFSEYFRVYLRPSYEFKNYKVLLSETRAINHRQPALYIHFGFRYNIPELPRCPLKAKNPTGYDYPKKFTNKTCRTQKKHIHGDQAYRGQPFYKKQNPKIGENHPNLHKYRLFNRRKVSGGY
jgi:hypothetical protein